MFETTQEELEQFVKEREEMYEGCLEDLKKDNEYLIKSSEELFKARIELLKFKLKNIKKLEEINGHEDRVYEESRDFEDRTNKLS